MNILDSKVIEKIMKEPVFIENSEYVKKSRNMLLSFSTITIFLIYFNLSIKDDSSVLGLKFNGLNENNIIVTNGFINLFDGANISIKN